MSVPPTGLPSATLTPNQTRHLPTRVVNLSAPDADGGLKLPAKGENLRIVGDVSKVTDNELVQKALKRLAAEKAPTVVAQLVMWNLSAGLDWDAISRLSEKWANDHELTLAKDFVNRLSTLKDGESGRLLFQFDTSDQGLAADLAKSIQDKTVLGLVGQVGLIPSSPDGPAVACRVVLKGEQAQVQVMSSDATGQGWVPFGKFAIPMTKKDGKLDLAKFDDALAEGVLSRLVRAQLMKGVHDAKGKLVHQLRIDNASPFVLNGIGVLGAKSNSDEVAKYLAGITIAPRRSLTVPTPDDFVKSLGLKKGTRVVALDLSGL